MLFGDSENDKTTLLKIFPMKLSLPKVLGKSRIRERPFNISHKVILLKFTASNFKNGFKQSFHFSLHKIPFPQDQKSEKILQKDSRFVLKKILLFKVSQLSWSVVTSLYSSTHLFLSIQKFFCFFSPILLCKENPRNFHSKFVFLRKSSVHQSEVLHLQSKKKNAWHSQVS